MATHAAACYWLWKILYRVMVISALHFNKYTHTQFPVEYRSKFLWTNRYFWEKLQHLLWKSLWLWYTAVQRYGWRLNQVTDRCAMPEAQQYKNICWFSLHKNLLVGSIRLCSLELCQIRSLSLCSIICDNEYFAKPLFTLCTLTIALQHL